ncbi:putative protease [Desulfonatronum thiosulfatophilum]|uniref:Putative protease n=1 Tax=Desulfonatronum thiosulfatophilum TaxID=617002 RepID=A0A1G6A0C5_9BACT|nr:peptidase U32 family protein [Desulfonatronum thiosulfatophilum]SDB01918.1 putative protease [Desulfonatronum thiosulfatophilum]
MAFHSPCPELLAPAGNPVKFQAALLYGADAVYLGGPSLNLRAGADGFGREALSDALVQAHSSNVKIYYCLNAFPQEKDLGLVRTCLELLSDMGDACVDGLIVADPGVFFLARKILPHVPIHVSTQANTGNSAAAAFWRELGATRINLARELALGDIRSLARAVPDLELEMFVHGAMCLALSGRCSLSAYLNARSANKGSCTQPCRFKYRAKAMAVEEQLRPGEILWEVLEDEDYTAFFSPRDLCLVKYLPWIWKNQIRAVKIEGRMRSAAYVALTCDVYRTALDDLGMGRFRPSLYLHELGLALHRPMDSGFFLPGAPSTTARRWDCAGRMTMVGHLIRQEGQEKWMVQVLDRWDAAKPLELVLPGLRRPVVEASEYGLENERGEKLAVAHPGQRVLLSCGHPSCRPGMFVRQDQPERISPTR